ncbi:unnamed protein product, partial [Amoebophrya sp. A25]
YQHAPGRQAEIEELAGAAKLQVEDFIPPSSSEQQDDQLLQEQTIQCQRVADKCRE